MSEIADAGRCRVLLRGHVQGIGVRPAVARWAAHFRVRGLVRNTAEGVELELQGEPSNLRAFLDHLPQIVSTSTSIQVEDCRPGNVAEFKEFTIETSTRNGSIRTAVPLDRSVCDACLSDARAISDRRYNYPFVNCVTCGPRYSLLNSLPYDRTRTAMVSFAACDACQNEYANPADRRGHAQTNCCPTCGPKVWLVDADGRQLASGTTALDMSSAALIAGKIMAMKGVGGYQLLVDATNPDAVRRLRRRKRRSTKPLAIMVATVEDATRIALLDDAEMGWLIDAANPIVVLRRREASPVAVDVAPNSSTLGIFLPSTSLHALILDRAQRPLVVTSGNIEGEPLVVDESSARHDLAGIADLWLHHDRTIIHPIDDSVLRVMDRRACVLRLARGLAPKVLTMPANPVGTTPIIALGGEQKGALAVYNGGQAVLGPHIGDLSSTANCERWLEHLQAFRRLYGIEAPAWAHDTHPNYFSTRWSEQQQGTRFSVQHHHAHVAATLVEYGRWHDRVLGIAWDGSGWGPDGSIWGGEYLVASLRECQRVAHVRPFLLPGGEVAIRQPWRTAVSLVHAALGPVAAARLRFPDVTVSEIESVVNLLDRPHLSPRTSSMGRIFDAVAALALGITHSQFEGHAAMALEHACDRNELGVYSLPLESDRLFDWRGMISQVVDDVRSQDAGGRIAMRFHRGLAECVVDMAGRYVDLPVVTCGGVFQNAVLVELLAERLNQRPAGWMPSLAIPPGDGGLAAGQLAVAMSAVQVRDRGCGENDVSGRTR